MKSKRTHDTDHSSTTAKENRRSLNAAYESPSIQHQGHLGELVRGASWKGVDSVGEIDPDNSYPS